MPERTADFTLETVAWTDPRAIRLREVMDEEMHDRYATRMPADDIERNNALMAALSVDPADVAATVVALDSDGTPLGHAALRLLRGEWEVKRVVVTTAARGRGVATAIMAELARIAEAAGASRLILQTGDRQPEAVALYEKIGYSRIPIYEPYVEAIPFSICFEKVLRPAA
ncbi:MAG: family N-acetyltransferase [Subtercola sp.]|nr:family N-acetyltransferase [Subtercola sp.]